MTKTKLDDYISDGALDLSLNQLKEFPFKNNMKVPKSVVTFNFSNNFFVSLPPHICTISHIQEIDISKNKLKSLPDNFGDLTNLRKLDLYQNELSYLPISFHKLQKLKWLDGSSNPLSPGLLNILGPCQSSEECEAAARKVVQYFQLLIKQMNKQVQEKGKKSILPSDQVLIKEEQKVEAKPKKNASKDNKKNETSINSKNKSSVNSDKNTSTTTLEKGSRLKFWVYIFIGLIAMLLSTWIPFFKDNLLTKI